MHTKPGPDKMIDTDIRVGKFSSYLIDQHDRGRVGLQTIVNLDSHKSNQVTQQAARLAAIKLRGRYL